MVALNRISTWSVTNDSDERFLKDDHQKSDISISIRLKGPKNVEPSLRYKEISITD